MARRVAHRSPDRGWLPVATAPGARPRGLGPHPRTVDRLRSLLAHRSLVELVVLFFFVLVVASLVLGLLFEVTDGRGRNRSFWGWWIESFTLLTTIPLSGAVEEGGTHARQLVQAAGAFGGVVLPALFLGAVVFKFFVAPEVYVVRDKAALLRTDDGGWELRIRLYSATRLWLIEVCATAELHAEVLGAHERVARYHELRVTNSTWPLTATHIPFSVRIPLDRGDVTASDTEPELVRVQGIPVQPLDFLMLTIRARAPELAGDLAETHVFAIPDDISTAAPVPITPVPWADAATWEGWPDFDAGPDG